MTATSAVHRCAFHAGAEEAGRVAVELCRRAVAAGSPVVAHVDDAVRRALTEELPGAPVTFAPQQRLVRVPPRELADEWSRLLAPGSGRRVAVLSQPPPALLSDAARWRSAEHEATAAVAVRPVELSCLVDTAAAPPAAVATARSTHPLLWCSGTDLPNPELEAAPRPAAGTELARRTLDPHAAAGNRAWWTAVMADAGLSGTLRDELVLVLHEAVRTAADLSGHPDGVPVRVARDGAAVACEVAVAGAYPALHPHEVPADRRLLLLWLAEKVSPAVSLAVLPAGSGSRFVVRAEHPDGG
ncbi:hypothetical protein SAMN04488107_1697 [Geodermatophilus saharensis]|uniref:MEDS domain-containing protein n=1 Tax=Geodermatophilus saharensis TaxID=1137994 RepID=A0A239CMC7_9ACTN|nr:hypothetical protein [Geodermatophilus saharensis]SNS20841.1 hypothetical protein SAMN04488107_1697 [Geodermatophilus saharensis]